MESTHSFLFVTWEGGGNVPPVLGLARRLTTRGHDVRVLTEPCLRHSVERLGARFLAFERHFTRTDRNVDIVRDWETGSPIGSLKRAFDNILFGPIRSVAQETEAAIRQEAPQVVVADLHMPGALIAAEAAGLPRAVLFHMPEYLPGPGRPAAGPGFLPRSDVLGRLRDSLLVRLFYRQLRPYLGAINAVRSTYGLPRYAAAEEILNLYHDADLRLIQTSEAFDFPISPAPPNVRYVGPVLDDPDWAPLSWENPWPADDDRPLIVISLSSTYQNQKQAVQRAIAALGDLDVRGLATLGPSMAGENFEVPGNVMAVPTASHAQVFPHASAVVTHGGHGTIMRALSSGLPLVCLPMGRDQNDNAARVVAHSVGVRLRPTAPVKQIREAVQRVLTEPSFRSSAERLKNAIAEDVAANRAVHDLEGLAERVEAWRMPEAI